MVDFTEGYAVAVEVKPNQFLVDAKGRPEGVILSLKAYRVLIRLADDRDDTRALRRAVRTSRGTIAHHELLGRLKRHGLL